MKGTFTFYFAKQTISHLNINKGDRFFKKNGKIYFRRNGREVPAWLNLDSEEYFGRENEPYKYNVGETVRYGVDVSRNVFKSMVTGIVTDIDERFITIKRDNSNGMIDKVPYSSIKEKIEVYYFINSKGKVQSDYAGRDTEADDYRKKIGNFFTSKDKAREERAKIG